MPRGICGFVHMPARGPDTRRKARLPPLARDAYARYGPVMDDRRTRLSRRAML